MKKIHFIALWCLIGIPFNTTWSQTDLNTMPKIIMQDGHHLLLVDGQPFFMLGGQVHNSSAWPAMLPHVWSAIHMMHANTLEIPVYWEQIEAQQGKYDFSLLDTLLRQGREHKIHLVLLWFGTWKNGSNHYMPEWIKLDAKKYPNITGLNGQPVDSPSPFTKEALIADAKAFSSLMQYLKDADPEHTVLMVQVENEPGSWGSVRDYSVKAKKIFDGPVPTELLKPEVLKALKIPIDAKGTWKEVFGDNADEYFNAWSIAKYIEYVAAVGKAVNPLPLYVNVALRDPFGNPPASTYESGGATDNVIPIWKAVASDIDLLAPDIYFQDTKKVLKVIELYDRSDNVLFVPETEYARYFYVVLAHGGIGFSLFGIDDDGQKTTTEDSARLAPIAQEYAMAAPMIKDLVQWGSEGKIKAVVEYEDHAEQTINLGNWQAIISFNTKDGDISQRSSSMPFGKVMVVTFGANEFVLIGTHCHLTFRPTGTNIGKAWQYLKVEEGEYKNGVFNFLRILNGDETDWGGPSFSNLPTLLHVTLTAR